MNKRALEKLFAEHGFSDFKWLDPKDIELAQWVRMKCQFGCDEYAKQACCPPNMPEFSECQRFFSEYQHAAVFHFEKKLEKLEDKKEWNKEVSKDLLAVEREVFLSGYYKALVLFMSSCSECPDCTPKKEDCRHPEKCRPAPDSLCMDVFATVRKLGYPIDVLTDVKDPMNRYAFLLID